MSQPSAAASLVQHVSSFSYSILRAKPFINCSANKPSRADPDRYLIPDIMPSVAMLAQGIFSPTSGNPVPIALGLWRFSMTFSLMSGKSHLSWIQFYTVSFWNGS